MAANVIRRVRAIPVLAQDATLAVVVALFEVVSLAVAVGDQSGGDPTPAIGYALLAVTQLPLAWRRRAPLLTWALVGAGTLAYGMTSWVDPPVLAGALLAIYSVAAHAPPRRALITLVITDIGVAVAWAFDPAPHDLNDVLLPVLGLTIAWLVGFAIASHRRNFALLEERAARLDRERATEAEQLLIAERMRIARELHDMTAHHVAVIAVHAEAGQSIVNDDPEEAARSFATIGRSARHALRDLRKTLGVLREDGVAARVPLPGIADVSALVEELGATGVDVEIDVSGDWATVTDDVDLAAYRIVQEAVTNILKHADARHATVRVCRGPDAVDVEVVDDGSGSAERAATSGGHGIVGMRERAESCRGTLTVGRTTDGSGFRVHARLPT